MHTLPSSFSKYDPIHSPLFIHPLQPSCTTCDRHIPTFILGSPHFDTFPSLVYPLQLTAFFTTKYDFGVIVNMLSYIFPSFVYFLLYNCFYFNINNVSITRDSHNLRKFHICARKKRLVKCGLLKILGFIVSKFAIASNIFSFPYISISLSCHN